MHYVDRYIDIFQMKESFMPSMLSYIAQIEICIDELNSSFIHDRSTPDGEPLSHPMIKKEIHVTNLAKSDMSCCGTERHLKTRDCEQVDNET